MSPLKKSKNKKGFLPEIVSKNKSQECPKQIKQWETIHIDQLPKIPNNTWNKELEGKIEKPNVEDGLSLDDSLRKSLTLINTFQRHEPGEEKSTKFLMLEMNEFFIQMAEELRYLKSNVIHDKINETKNESFNDNFYYGSNKKIAKLFKNIKSMECKIQEQHSEMKIIEDERKEIHEEIRSLIDESLDLKQKKILDKNFPYYLLNKSDEVKKEEMKTVLEDKHKEQKQKISEEKNFIEKNIKLAKDRTMYNSKCSLTDEEKIKLANLLKDMEEKSEPNPNKYLKSYEEIVDNYDIHKATLTLQSESVSNDENLEEEFGFKLHGKDSKILTHLNEELEKIDEKKYDFSETNLVGGQFQEDRPWRKQFMKNKLNDIEKNLTQIANKRNEENTKSENNAFIYNSEEIEEIRREFYESVEEMKHIFEKVDNTVDND